MDVNELKKQIENAAELQFTDCEIAKIVEISYDELIKKYSASIDKGRLQAESLVRQSMFQLAKQGSTPAQKQFMLLNEAAKGERRKIE